MRLRVGIVPEHFSLPLRLGVAKHIFEKCNVELALEVYGKGTGSMCRALRNNELDVALTVTEGVIYGNLVSSLSSEFFYHEIVLSRYCD